MTQVYKNALILCAPQVSKLDLYHTFDIDPVDSFNTVIDIVCIDTMHHLYNSPTSVQTLDSLRRKKGERFT